MAGLRFKPLDHPSDVGIIAYGKTTKELFENAAFGLFSLMADLETVVPKQMIMLSAKGDDQGTLMVNWLNELIYLADAKKLLLRKFSVKKLSDTLLEAEVWGEKIDLARHSLTRSVKAATYNQLQIVPGEAKIVFDV